jgi:hypothetical protein
MGTRSGSAGNRPFSRAARGETRVASVLPAPHPADILATKCFCGSIGVVHSRKSYPNR